jgi:gliding motility-associated-like protein
VYISNAFSPNGDGVNDFFNIQGHVPNVKEIQSLIIFDRWGTKVFEKFNLLPNDLSSGWDGTFRGQQVQEDTYIFVTEVEFLDDFVGTYSGEIHLIR